MADESVVVKGVIHGKTIELETTSGFEDGQAVSVVVRAALPPGEGLREAFGAWADDSQGLDEFLNRVYQNREDGRSENAR